MSVHSADGATYDSNGRLLRHTHDSLANRDGIIYIGENSDAETDGSKRFRFDSDEDNVTNLEALANGVWNDDGLRLGSSSLKLGFNSRISFVAGFIEISDLSAVTGHQFSFLPHTEIGPLGNTTSTHAPSMDIAKTFVVFAGAVSEETGTTIGINLLVLPARAIVTSIHEVGSIGATDEVVVRFYKGSDNTGTLFDKKTLPASDLIADTTLEIDYDQDLGFEGNQNIFMEFKSDTAFSLKTDASGNPLTSHFAHELKTLGIVTENLMLDDKGDFMLDGDSNPMYAGQFL